MCLSSNEGDHTPLGSEAEDTGTTGTSPSHGVTTHPLNARLRIPAVRVTTPPLEARLRILVPLVPLQP